MGRFDGIERIELRFEQDDPVLLALNAALAQRGRRVKLTDLLYEIVEAWALAQQGDWRRLIQLLPAEAVAPLLSVAQGAPAAAPAVPVEEPAPAEDTRPAQQAASAWLDMMDE